MKRNCPNSNCKKYLKPGSIVKDGHFKRKGDSRYIQRFKCRLCSKKFSASTHSLSYRQQKRRANSLVFKLLASGVSMRRTAKILKLSRGTVTSRLIYFGEKSRRKNFNTLKALENKVNHLQFDDLITKENSKLKPLAVSIAVDAQKRLILAGVVSQIPSFGHLSKYSVARYGHRKCDHKIGLDKMFRLIKSSIHPNALISSDEHKKYPEFVSKYFPQAQFETYKGERGCIAGLGELKKVRFDPLFAINHTCAMFRANINRLIRRTWCSTKDPERLQDHIDIFICYFNSELLKSSNFIPNQ